MDNEWDNKNTDTVSKLPEEMQRVAILYAANLFHRAYIKAGGCGHCKSYDPLCFDYTDPNRVLTYVFELKPEEFRSCKFENLGELEELLVAEWARWFKNFYDELPIDVLREAVKSYDEKK